jgi:hypothetical protein
MLRATTNIDNFSALSYQGTWNASTNSPTLTSSVGTAGYYYIVSVAGSTSLNGISSWAVGDWVIFSNTGVWQKIAGGSAGSINISNDTSSNTNYNLSLTNLSSGTVSGLTVDSTQLTFNPSTKTLLITDTTNQSTPFYNAVNSYYGSSFTIGGCVANDEWIHGSILGDSAIRANSGNLALGSYSGLTIIGTKLTTSVIINSAGALSFGSSTPSYGTAGQVLTSNGSGTPTWTGGGASKTTNGYAYLPNGLILQWGQVAATGGSGARNQTITLPIAFPNGFLNVVGSDVGGNCYGYGVTPTSNSTFLWYIPAGTIGASTTVALSTAATLTWQAVGY